MWTRLEMFMWCAGYKNRTDREPKKTPRTNKCSPTPKLNICCKQHKIVHYILEGHVLHRFVRWGNFPEYCTNTWLDVEPCPHVLMLFLYPADLGTRVFQDLFFYQVERERRNLQRIRQLIEIRLTEWHEINKFLSTWMVFFSYKHLFS